MTRRSVGRRREPGQVVVLFALFLVVLLAASALSIDYGTWLKSRREYQNVADAAALAGSGQLVGTGTCTPKVVCAREAAWASLRDQLGLSLNPTALAATNTAEASPYLEAGYRLWVDSPPSGAGAKYGGAYASNTGTVFALVERDNPSFVGQIVGQGNKTVSAWATAGLFKSSYAVASLCPYPGPCPQADNIWIAGTNTGVRVFGGDVGSNWHLKVTSGTSPGLMLPGGGEAYFFKYEDCASATWSCGPGTTGGIQDPGPPAVYKPALPLRSMLVDPAYPLPPWIDDATAVPGRPDFNQDSTADPIDATQSTVRCPVGSSVIGPGSYDTIRVTKGCLILDPTLGLTAGQQPGIFRIRNKLIAANGAFIIGDGVSLFFDTTVSSYSIGNDGGIVINTGNAGSPGQSKAAWTTRGASPWTTAGSPPTASYDPSAEGVGMAFYVRKPATGATSIFNMSGAAGIQFRGVLYAPKDAVGIGGNSAQHSAGTIVAWTIKYNGGTVLDQTFEGAADERPLLLEPTLGQ